MEYGGLELPPYSAFVRYRWSDNRNLRPFKDILPIVVSKFLTAGNDLLPTAPITEHDTPLTSAIKGRDTKGVRDLFELAVIEKGKYEMSIVVIRPIDIDQAFLIADRKARLEIITLLYRNMDRGTRISSRIFMQGAVKVSDYNLLTRLFELYRELNMTDFTEVDKRDLFVALAAVLATETETSAANSSTIALTALTAFHGIQPTQEDLGVTPP